MLLLYEENKQSSHGQPSCALLGSLCMSSTRRRYMQQQQSQFHHKNKRKTHTHGAARNLLTYLHTYIQRSLTDIEQQRALSVIILPQLSTRCSSPGFCFALSPYSPFVPIGSDSRVPRTEKKKDARTESPKLQSRSRSFRALHVRRAEAKYAHTPNENKNNNQNRRRRRGEIRSC